MSRRIRDEESQELILEAQRKAERLIRSNREQLEGLAAELLANEVLERDAIDRVMSAGTRVERSPDEADAPRLAATSRLETAE
jgi:ATP-dependent Zn protease